MKFVAALTLASAVLAAPSPSSTVEKRTSFGEPFSLNNFGGFSSLSNFDSFFGVSNFGGLSNQINIIDSSGICSSNIGINIVQQQLAIMAEFTKQLLLEQICEVEVQQLLFSQFLTGLNGFGSDLLRFSGNSFVSFDRNIASLVGGIFVDNRIVSNDFGFIGSDIGLNSVSFSSNWVDATSPLSVVQALSAAQRASISSGGFFSGF